MQFFNLQSLYMYTKFINCCLNTCISFGWNVKEKISTAKQPLLYFDELIFRKWNYCVPRPGSGARPWSVTESWWIMWTGSWRIPWWRVGATSTSTTDTTHQWYAYSILHMYIRLNDLVLTFTAFRRAEKLKSTNLQPHDVFIGGDFFIIYIPRI